MACRRPVDTQPGVLASQVCFIMVLDDEADNQGSHGGAVAELPFLNAELVIDGQGL